MRVAVTVRSALFERLGRSTGAQKAKYRSVMFNLRAENNTGFWRRVLIDEVTPKRLPSSKKKKRTPKRLPVISP